METNFTISTILGSCLNFSDELQDTPDHWTGVECGRPEPNDRYWYYNCLKDFEIGLYSTYSIL